MRESSNSVRSTAKKILAFSAKDRIDHSVFGLGTIVQVGERHTTIASDESGTRKFVTNMVKLSASDTPAPARRVRKRKKAVQAR